MGNNDDEIFSMKKIEDDERIEAKKIEESIKSLKPEIIKFLEKYYDPKLTQQLNKLD